MFPADSSSPASLLLYFFPVLLNFPVIVAELFAYSSERKTSDLDLLNELETLAFFDFLCGPVLV